MSQPNIHWLTARQVAEHYAVSLRTVDKWAESGALRAYRTASDRIGARFRGVGRRGDAVATPWRSVAVR